MTKDLEDYDIILKVCDFKTPSKSAHKIIDKSSFEKLINNPEFISKMDSGKLLGLFTHKGRQPREQVREIPYEDNIAISPYLCNVTTKLWIDGDELHAGMKLIKDSEYGKKLMQLIKAGIMVPVSMSVKAHSDFKRYYVDDFYGIDFTFRPDLEAEVLNVNFSEGGSGIYEFSYILNESDIQVNLVNEDNFSAIDLYTEFCDASDEEIDYAIKDIAKKAINEVKGISSDMDKLPEVIAEIRSVRRKLKNNSTSELKSKLSSLESQKRDLESKLGITDAKNKAKSIISKSDTGKKLLGLGKYVNIAKHTYSEFSYLIEFPDGTYLDLDEKGHVNYPKEAAIYDDRNDAIKKAMELGGKVVEFSNSESNEDFSIKEVIVENRMRPAQVLRRRINELIQFVGTKKQEFIDSNDEVIRAYISNYIMQWIQFTLNNPDEPFNISLGLRLTDYVTDRSKLVTLQRLLTKARTQLLKSGSMPVQLQKELNLTYQIVLNEVFNYINNKLVSKGVKI